MNKALDEVAKSTEFNEELFKTVVERIDVYDDHSADFVFKCGITVKEKIEE